MEEHVTQDIAGGLEMRTGDFDVVARILLAREGIELSSERVDGRAYIFGGRIFFTSFEEHMFEEVADSPFALIFISRSRSHEDSHCCRGAALGLRCENGEA